jgi:plasmid stabilization system protein ParE
VSWRLDIRPAALADIEGEAAWYEQRQQGLGRAFAKTIRRAIARLPDNPLIYGIRSRRLRIRWFIPPRFPYRIVYRVDGDLVTVLAVIHGARHDREWRKRARSA